MRCEGLVEVVAESRLSPPPAAVPCHRMEAFFVLSKRRKTALAIEVIAGERQKNEERFRELSRAINDLMQLNPEKEEGVCKCGCVYCGSHGHEGPQSVECKLHAAFLAVQEEEARTAGAPSAPAPPLRPPEPPKSRVRATGKGKEKATASGSRAKRR